MKNLAGQLILIFAILPIFLAGRNESKWPLYIYNFGGLDDFTIAEQVTMTKDAGYAGMIVGIAPNTLERFDDYRSAARKTEGFDIHAAFYVLYDKEGNLGPKWKEVIDEVVGTEVNLWLITGRASDKVSKSDLKESLSNFVSYANEKRVPVSLYPHSRNMIDNAEQAARMIEEICPLKLELAFILCHEMRIGNASRIEAVIQNVGHHIGHVVISGSDTDLTQNTGGNSDYEKLTLQPLFQGEFDMRRVLNELVKVGYNGKMGYINHRFDARVSWDSVPSDYLRKSMNTYKDWLAELDFPDDFGSGQSQKGCDK